MAKPQTFTVIFNTLSAAELEELQAAVAQHTKIPSDAFIAFVEHKVEDKVEHLLCACGRDGGFFCTKSTCPNMLCHICTGAFTSMYEAVCAECSQPNRISPGPSNAPGM